MGTNKEVWIVGSKGMLGQELALLLKEKGVGVLESDLEVSILDSDALSRFVEQNAYGSPTLAPSNLRSLTGLRWIVNCAAYTAVDRAEEEPEICRRLNVEGPRNLARLAKSIGARLIHLSTDYVFKGEVPPSGGKYTEEDTPAPQSVYGRTKLEGEEAVREELDLHIILRTAWLYGKYGKNFVYTMLNLMKERDFVGVVADQRGSPTWARDLAGAIYHIVQSPNPRFGIYHFTNEGETTWFDFAREIYRLGRAYGMVNRVCEIRPLTTDQYPTKARRPAYSVLSKEKIKKDYGVPVPPWQESLELFIGSLANP
ncbi:MAG: dTDP-4-dehydrorhamnose reductase [Spirochaetales bacterium]